MSKAIDLISRSSAKSAQDNFCRVGSKSMGDAEDGKVLRGLSWADPEAATSEQRIAVEETQVNVQYLSVVRSAEGAAVLAC